MSNECPRSLEPLATRPVADGEDLTGRLVGSLTVMGYAKHYPRSWVVRCGCGRYTTRTSRALRNPANAEDTCDACRKRPAEAVELVVEADAAPAVVGSAVDLGSLFAPTQSRRLRNVVTAGRL
jgi:hypothetical protein